MVSVLTTVPPHGTRRRSHPLLSWVVDRRGHRNHVRNHRLDLLRTEPGRRPGHCVRDDRDHGLPGPGRRRRVAGRQRRARPPPPRRHRHRGRRATHVGRARRPHGTGHHLQRRDLQLPRTPVRAADPGPPLRDQQRHRGGSARLPGVGGGVHRTPQRHVRLRAVGPDTPRTAAGPRPDGDQAALLLPDLRRHRLRLRTQGDPGPPAGARGRRRRGHGRAAGLREDPRPRRLPGHARTAPGAHAAGDRRRRDRTPLLGP